MRKQETVRNALIRQMMILTVTLLGLSPIFFVSDTPLVSLHLLWVGWAGLGASLVFGAVKVLLDASLWDSPGVS